MIFFKKKKQSKIPPINVCDKNYIKDFVYKWNTTYPIDRWWRLKHKVAFNSPEHRVMSFIDMKIEWEEDCIFESLYKESEYKINQGKYMKESINDEVYLSDSEKIDKYKKEFKNIDLSQYD